MNKPNRVIDECRKTPRGWARASLAAALIVSTLFLWGMARRADTPPPSFSIHTLLAGVHMAGNQGTEPSAEWILSRQALQKIFSDAASHTLPASAAETTAEVDLAAYRVLLVRMGLKPTAGYSLHCLPERSGLDGATAVVAVQWSTPPPGQAGAQVVTNPFVLLKISKRGYNRVKVVDQNDQTLFELASDD